MNFLSNLRLIFLSLASWADFEILLKSLNLSFDLLIPDTLQSIYHVSALRTLLFELSIVCIAMVIFDACYYCWCRLQPYIERLFQPES